MAQWTECQPVNQKVTSSIPSQSTCLGCGPGPQLGVWERQLIDVSLVHRCFSPSLSPFLPLPLVVNTSLKEFNLKEMLAEMGFQLSQSVQNMKIKSMGSGIRLA